MNTALWFSGGKDSMTCLFLLKDRLQDIYVLFANTGKYYPELLQTVAAARDMCPNWIEVKTDRDSQWARNGLPADVVPIDWTIGGQKMSSVKQVSVQNYQQCCSENISWPLWLKSKELGCTKIIRGQRADESHRSTSNGGDMFEGITFEHPIEGWTKAEVMDYLSQKMEIPAHYALEHSSMDCYDCTAFADHSLDRLKYTRDKHPKLYAEYSQKLLQLRDALTRPLQSYAKLFGEVANG